MTSNPHNYGKAPVREEGAPITYEEPSLEDQLVEQMGQVKVLRRYRYIYNRLAVIAKEGNLMINHPDQGFVLIDDLEKYMTEPL
jgi:alpha-L-fucosidase